MAKKLPIWDQRMFELLQVQMDNPENDIEEEMDFFRPLGVNDPPTVSQVRAGKQSFRLKHFKAACDLYGVSMDWFFGYTDRMLRQDIKIDPLALLKQATRLIEKEMMPQKKVIKKVIKKRAKT